MLWAVERGITNGTMPYTFAPNETVTRGQAVTFLWRAAGSPEADGENNYQDVAPGMFYADAVNWAVEKGITYGTSLTTFSPDEPCTRGQIVTFMQRSA